MWIIQFSFCLLVLFGLSLKTLSMGLMMSKFELVSIDVFLHCQDVFEVGDEEYIVDGISKVTLSPCEAFLLCSMPSVCPIIEKFVPNYELSEVPKE